VNLEKALPMTTEEHKENEGKILPRMMALLTNHPCGEMLGFSPSSKIGCYPDENPLFPSFASVELPLLR